MTPNYIEILKDVTAKCLIEAIEYKNLSLVKKLFDIYYEVQQIHLPMDYEFNLKIDNSNN